MPEKDLQDYISAAKDRIVFTVTNSGNSVLALNLALSAQRHQIEVGVLDLNGRQPRQLPAGIEWMTHKNPRYPLAIARSQSRRAMPITKSGFGPLAWSRYPAIREVLEAGLEAIYLDTDVVVRGEFVDRITEELQNSSIDGAVQTNTRGEACTGILAFHPRSLDSFRQVFSDASLERHGAAEMRGLFDQDFFNRVVLNPSRPLLRMSMLEESRFPTGIRWYATASQDSERALLVHYNGVIGVQDKIQKMREHGDFFVKK